MLENKKNLKNKEKIARLQSKISVDSYFILRYPKLKLSEISENSLFVKIHKIFQNNDA